MTVELYDQHPLMALHENHVDALTPAQNRFINKLPINKDIKIVELFRAHCGRNPKPEENSRYQQQVIGTPISRINRKLKPQSLKIVPGIKRRTYRLIKI